MFNWVRTMNDLDKTQNELEKIATLVDDMHNLMSFYRVFTITNSTDDIFDIKRKIKKLEVSVLEGYEQFKDITKVKELYSLLCLTAKVFYKSKKAEKMQIQPPSFLQE